MSCSACAKPKRKERLIDNIRDKWILYVMMIPVLAYFIIYCYAPMYGVLLAFKKYRIKLGVLGSPFVGFDNFTKFFKAYNFESILTNTVGISLYSILVGFTIPILFALLLNYVRSSKLKKLVQTVSYIPHFISTVVFCGIIMQILKSNGVINTYLTNAGLSSVGFLTEPNNFWSLHVWTDLWKSLGWSAIIYISALSGIDEQLYDAAIVDGANKFQRILHIDLPGILPTITMMLILRLGSLMNVGFEKIYLLQNGLNIGTSEVISTYVYKIGMVNADYGYSTAVGLFNSAINLVFLVVANKTVKVLRHESLF